MEDPMATTSLIVETLIAGLQALVWVALGLILFRGTTWIDFLALKDWVSLILFFVVAVAYTLGIIVERSASFFMGWIEDRFEVKEAKSAIRKETNVSESNMRMEIMNKDSTLSAFIEGHRHQYRMLASTTINVFIYLVLILIAYAFPGWLSQEERIQNFAHYLSPILFYFLLILFISTVIHWWYMRRSFHKHVQYAHTLVSSQKSGDSL